MNTLKGCDNKQDWDDYILDNGGHPLQLWAWGEVKAGHGWKADRQIMLDDDGNFLAAAQILVRHLPWPFRSIAYIPRGPVGRVEGIDFLSQLASYVKQEYHSLALSIEPDVLDFEVPEGWHKSANRILPAETIILDLSKDEEVLLADMAKKTRQYINKSSKDVSIKPVRTRQDLDKCLDIYDLTATRANFKLHDRNYYYDIFDQLGENSLILAAYHEAKIVSFLWIALSAEVAFELYGGMNDIGRETRSNFALKWAMVKKCKEWGISRYDFGGLIGGGVSTFKLAWTKQPLTLAGTFDYPLSSFYGLWSRLLPLLKRLKRRQEVAKSSKILKK